MKKFIVLAVSLVLILLTFSSCAENNTSSAENSSENTTSTESSTTETSSQGTSIGKPGLTDEQLAKEFAPILGIPEKASITYVVSESYNYDMGGCYYKNIDFYENGVLVAHASAEIFTGEIISHLYGYTNRNSQAAEVNFFDYFDDVEFAWYIADKFDKYPDEAVTEEELASFSGNITITGNTKNLAGIGYLKSITELYLSKCDVKEIPSEISECKNLKRLNMLKAYFTSGLPESIGELQNLEFLSINLSGADKLPESIGNLKKLKYLYAAGCGMTTVPESIGECESLAILDLHSNKITSVPDSICNLKNLKSLDLGYTNITALPENIGNLKELIRLDLFGLDIRQLPQSMKNMTKLEFLNVYNNYNLNEDYKQWFPNGCYKCLVDPENSKDWDDGFN